MTPLARQDLRGVWGTVLPPWAGDRLDSDALRTQIEALLEAGLDGIYAHGTAGEPHALSDEELTAVDEAVATAAGERGIPFQLGTGRTDVAAALIRIRQLRELVPGAIQIVLPGWIAPQGSEVLRWLEMAAEAADPIPLVLYNPPHAKQVLDPEALAMLVAQVPAIVGVKVGAGGSEWYSRAERLIELTAVFVPGHALATGYARGAAGSYSNIAALSPRGAVAWWDILREDEDAGIELEQRISGFFERHIAPLQLKSYSNPALDRFLAVVGGWSGLSSTQIRSPYRSVPHALVGPAHAEARNTLPELFPEA